MNKDNTLIFASAFLAGVFILTIILLFVVSLITGFSFGFITYLLVSSMAVLGFGVIFEYVRKTPQNAYDAASNWFPERDPKTGHAIPIIKRTGLRLWSPDQTFIERVSCEGILIEDKVEIMSKDNIRLIVPFTAKFNPDPNNPYPWLLLAGDHDSRVQMVKANVITAIQGTIDANVKGKAINIMKAKKRNAMLRGVRAEFRDLPAGQPLTEGHKLELGYGIQIVEEINLGDISLTPKMVDLLETLSTNQKIDEQARNSVELSGGTLNFAKAKQLILLGAKMVEGKIDMREIYVNSEGDKSGLGALVTLAETMKGGNN